MEPVLIVIEIKTKMYEYQEATEVANRIQRTLKKIYIYGIYLVFKVSRKVKIVFFHFHSNIVYKNMLHAYNRFFIIKCTKDIIINSS